MAMPLKPWESTNRLANTSQIVSTSNLSGNPSSLRANIAPPALPPRPQAATMGSYGYNSGYSPYNSLGSSYSYGNYGSVGWPGRSLYSSGYGNGYNGFNGYGSSCGMYGNGYMNGMGIRDDAESRFIQFAEESSRNTFANVESIVRAFNGIAMMLDNTFFAMTSSFRAVLGVAENIGRLRSMFSHIWQAVNIFRLFTWLHRKMCVTFGVKMPPSTNSRAWNEAVSGIASETGGSSGSSWPTLAFFGILFSAPYFISKLLPKYEDKCDPEKWKNQGIKAKAVFDFLTTSSNELPLRTNDEILLAPKSVQEELGLSNSGWAYAARSNRSGVVPLNHIVIVKRGSKSQPVAFNAPNIPAVKPCSNKSNLSKPTTHPVSVLSNANNSSSTQKKVQKRVSFGETQIFDTDSEAIDQPITVPTDSPIEITDLSSANHSNIVDVKSKTMEQAES